MRGWQYASDTTCVYYAFSGKPTHVASVSKNLDRAIDAAQDFVGAPFKSVGIWHDADIACGNAMMPPFADAQVCKIEV